MNSRLSPADVYPDNPLLADYVTGRPETRSLFERAPGSYMTGGDRQINPDLVDEVRAYNEALGCSEATRRNLEALEKPGARCVIGGHQAIFLGGPAFTAYKILAGVRLARQLTTQTGERIVPIFWLASEDHDFGEIHRVRLLEADGSLRTLSFDWDAQGQAIETLPITEDVRSAFAETLAAMANRPHTDEVAGLLQPDENDDYATWHARVWSRLFADDGLIVLEPRTLRPFSGELFHEALRRDAEVRDALQQGATDVRNAGYEPALDPNRAGRLFLLDEHRRRRRIEDVRSHIDTAHTHPESYSTDAALRPILADALFPTIASVLGPGELAYQAMLKPLYELLGVHQPALVPRQGYTLVAPSEAQLLGMIGADPLDVVRGAFDAGQAIAGAVSASVSDAFDRAREDIEEALQPLRPMLSELNPSLDTRWSQTLQHAVQGVAKLEDRARRADLSQRGLSATGIRRLEASLRPTGKLQERVLSFIHFASLYGVEWLRQLPGAEEADTFTHHVATITGGR